MIKRIYIDNYKCLVNFECTFDNINLLLGTNGSGKSTVFDALRDIRDVATGTSPVSLFNESTLTRWQNRDLQTFELDVQLAGGRLWQYRLEVQHEDKDQRIRLESLSYDDKPIYRREMGTIEVFDEGRPTGTPTPWPDWKRSCLPFIYPALSKHVNVARFIQWLQERLICLRIDPRRIKPTASEMQPVLDAYAENFAAWYWRQITLNLSLAGNHLALLREMWEDFSLGFEEKAGGDMRLVADVAVREEEERPVYVSYAFNEPVRRRAGSNRALHALIEDG